MILGMNSVLGSPLRNFVAGLAFLLLVSVFAVLAYVAYGWPLGDAIYMVVTTVYTVGYEEVRPIDTPVLRAITITLIVTGCTGVIFLTGTFVQIMTLSQLQQFFGYRRMQKDIDRLSGHVVICGYGRIGPTLARDLRAGRSDFVILERSEAKVEIARAQGFLALQGDATNEEFLSAAGVQRARALATVLPDDAANVFITLSARSLNREMAIIARGEAPSTESKLLQAGATRVVLPTHICAERMAELILFQEVSVMIEGTEDSHEVSRDLRRLGLDLEVLAAAPGSRAAGTTIGALEAEAGGAFLIVALNRRGGESILQPPPSTVIEAGDGVAVVGRPGRAAQVAKLFTGAKSVRVSARG
jgi:Trk K+ transport system NAD-binding subunit